MEFTLTRTRISVNSCRRRT